MKRARTIRSGSLAISPNSYGGATASDAIQLGGGSNSTAKTLQVYQWPLLDGNTGKIYSDRLPTSGSGADTSLSNITDAGKIVIAHNAMPSLTYDELTPTSGQTYTAPADGYFYVLGYTEGSSAYIEFYDSSNNEAESASVRLGVSFARTQGSTLPILFPVFKGQKVVLLYNYLSFSTSSPIQNAGMKFFYAVGSESEQQGA